MKYISHIKELVSGIIDNDLITRDTEGYNALTALKNHLESLEEVYKYMPYQDPGPVIQNLEEGLTHRNSEIQNLKAQLENVEYQLKGKTMSRDSCYKYWQEYKTRYETLEQKNQELKKVIEKLNKENAHYTDLIDQNHEAIENYQDLKKKFEKLNKENADYRYALDTRENAKAEIQDLKEDIKQKDSYIEFLKKETSDAQCDLDNWTNYKGPELEHQINNLEEETKILRSLLNEEQFTQYQEQAKCLSDPDHKTLYDQEQDKVGFLLRLLTQEQEEEYQEYLRTQLPDDQPQYHKTKKPNRKRKLKKQDETDLPHE